MSEKFAEILKSDITYEVLLPVYYKQDVEFVFVGDDGKNKHEVFPIKMIPDTGDFLSKRLDDIREKMEDHGYKVISINHVGNYVRMTDEEIDNHIKFGYLTLQINDWWKDIAKNTFGDAPLTNLGISMIYQLLK